MSEPILEITIEETAGIIREREPVMYGVPFPQGLISASPELQVVDDEGNRVPMAVTPIARWTDNSIKWMLFDFQVSISAKGKKCFRIYPEAPGEKEYKGIWQFRFK